MSLVHSTLGVWLFFAFLLQNAFAQASSQNSDFPASLKTHADRYYFDPEHPDVDFSELIKSYGADVYSAPEKFLAILYKQDPNMFRYPVINFKTRAPQHPHRMFFVSSNGKLVVSMSLSKKTKSVDVIRSEKNANQMPILRPHEFTFGDSKPNHVANPVSCHSCHGVPSQDERMFNFRWDGYNSWPRMAGAILETNEAPEKEWKEFLTFLKENADNPILQFTFKEWDIDPKRFNDTTYLESSAKILHKAARIALDRTTLALSSQNFSRMSALIRSHVDYPKYEKLIQRSLEPTIELKDEEFVSENDFNSDTFPATDLAELFGESGSAPYQEFLGRYQRRLSDASTREHQRYKDFIKLVNHISGVPDSTPSTDIVHTARLATVLSYMGIELKDLSMSTQGASYDFSTAQNGIRDFPAFLKMERKFTSAIQSLPHGPRTGGELIGVKCATCHTDPTESRGPFIKDWSKISSEDLKSKLTSNKPEEWMPKYYPKLSEDEVESVVKYIEGLQSKKGCP